MKKINYIAMALIAALPFSSCQDYLTVNPKTELASTVLLNSEAGFKDALTGVYIQMKNPDAYGAAMTMSTIEYPVSNWDVLPNTTGQSLSLFKYTDKGAESSLAAIYGKEYNIIANINSILGQIDEKKDVFKTPGMYETIKSECLALRAYCHLDLLRLFGPVPTAPTIGNKLPYVTALSKLQSPPLAFDQFQAALIKDLTDAEVLVKDIDPITKFSLSDLANPGLGAFKPADNYFGYRYLRMNYYAIKALEARAYLWFQNKDKAYECAKIVIDANAGGKPIFRLGTALDMANGDYALTSEQIFGLFENKLYTTFQNYFMNGFLAKNMAAVKNMYGNTGKDFRELNLWMQVVVPNAGTQYVLRKYYTTEGQSKFMQIPLLRISEMYFIAIETGPSAEAQTLWDQFQASRSVNTTTLPTDPTMLQSMLQKEYNKEFIGEGQSFFAYKRGNAPTSNMVFNGTTPVNFLIPMPKTELLNN